MGWLFSHQTKEDLLRKLLAPTSTFAGSTEVLAHAVSGNELWTVVKRTFHLAGFYFRQAGRSLDHHDRAALAGLLGRAMGLQDHSGESRPVLLRLSAGVPGPGSR